MRDASGLNDSIIQITDKDNHGLNYEERRIVDIDLLSKCDQLIVTGSSTFGYLAAIKSGRLPFGIDVLTQGNKSVYECRPGDLAHPPWRDTYTGSFKK